ncbi:transposable element Tc3 transposase [Trichonephila clavipes]|nr:transposable element Tc3 transposase [Trichonephila clavipes]
MCTFERLPIREGVLCGAGNTGIGETMNGDEYSLQMRAYSVSVVILIWRERESRNHPSNIIERDRGAMGLQFLFMDDNAPCHHTVAAEQLLESRRLAARTLLPVMIWELRLALQDEWAAIPQQLIDTLILSMGRRCETCLAVRGDHIPY